MKVSFRRLAYNVFFRFSPIIFVVLLELALRFFGVGESYLLFGKTEDAAFYELNPIYYRRFVSAEQFPEIKILPQKIPVEKPDDSYRIFLIGDQSMCSAFPEINTEQVLPDFDNNGKKYDIVQLAVPLTNSFAIKRLAHCIEKYDPDACVLVTGANEYYGLPRKNAWMRDIDNYWGLGMYVTMKNHRFIQVLERFVYMKRDTQEQFPPETPDDWAIAYNSYTYQESNRYFDRNIKRIARRSKCPVFFVSLPSNIKAGPYRSMFADKELSDSELVKECAVLVANADPFTIDRWINELEAWEPGTAIYYYCKAMIEEEINTQLALEYYNKALELDAFRVRFNLDMYHSIIKYAETGNAQHIDLYKRSNETTANGLKIDQYFNDGIRLNGKGRDLFISEIRSALITYFNQ